MNILFIDTETTGLDEKKNTVIEVACRLDVDGIPVSNFTTKFWNPTSTTDLGALKVNKVRIKDLVSGKPEETQVMEFVDWLLDIQDKFKGDLHVCGQNVHFDINFIKALLERYKVEGLSSVVGYKVIDTFGLALALVEVKKLIVPSGKINLTNTALALGLQPDPSKLHTAPGDVELTAQVLYGLLDVMRK